MATITVKAGKRTLKLTPAQAKDLHRQLDEIFEAEKMREAVRKMSEIAEKMKPKEIYRDAPPRPYFSMPQESPWRHERARYGEPTLGNSKRVSGLAKVIEGYVANAERAFGK